MRAAVFTEVGRPLTIETLPDPTPEAGEVVIKVHSCGICGTDLHMTENHGPMYTYPSGTIPGHEYAGEIVALGQGVEHLRVGDRVSALPFTGCGHCPTCHLGQPSHCSAFRGLGSGFSEYTLASARTTIPLPDALSFDDGALIEPMSVGLHGVAMAAIQPGDRVLVIGAGPIGLAAAFFASKMGAGSVAVSATSRRREALAMAMGADHFVLPDPDQGLPAAAAQALGSEPDVVLECAGQPGCIEQAIHSVGRKGTVVVMGFCTTPDTFLPAVAVWKEIQLRFSNTYSVGEFQHVANVLATGALQPRSMVTAHATLAETPQIFEALRQPNTHCKVIINPWA